MKAESLLILLCIVYVIDGRPSSSSSLSCHRKDIFKSIFICHEADANILEMHDICLVIRSRSQQSPPIFLFYDVNAFEGFNLRRDVYIRMTVFVRALRQTAGYENVVLVLPPFYQLYHWQLALQQQRQHSIDHTDHEDIVFWSEFFDLPSMRRFTDVIDLWQYFLLMQNCFGHRPGQPYHSNHVFKLKHFESMFTSGKFEEKFEVQPQSTCNAETNSRTLAQQFIGLYTNFTIHQLHCVEFQGSATLLTDLIKQYTRESHRPQAMAFLNAETVLHDHWGNPIYWAARRSMRFSRQLMKIANAYRANVLNSTDIYDHVHRPADWRHEHVHRTAIGGDYLCAHLRRADFLQGRESTTPSIRAAGTQIKTKATTFGIKSIFISSDCTDEEYEDLRLFLPRLKLYRFSASTESHERVALKPGGVAIVDQIVCSHARYFIGTYESTFTYRIYEEREIMGFPIAMTFNTFCKTHYETEKCQKNPVWPIAY